MITASALTRLRNCPSSAVLARAENHSAYADAGHDEHEELALGVDTGTLRDALAQVCPAGVDVDRIVRCVPAGARAEVKVGFDVALRVGRVIGYGGGRDYGTPAPFEVVGSMDVLGVEGDCVIVIDWKTGFADVEPAATNAQLWFYALAAARALGKERAIVRIIYTKTGVIDEHELDALDLVDFAGSLERLHRQVAERQAAKHRGEVLETREGSWCKHCASKHVCASKTGLLVQIAEKGLAVIGDTEMTPARAVKAYEQLVLIEQLVKDARARLTTFVEDQGPIDLGNGRMFGRYHKEGNRKLDADAAVQAIREVVGEPAEEFEQLAIERSTSQAAIERAAKAVAGAGRGAATKLKAAVLKRIDELGGMKREASYPIGEFATDKHEPAPLNQAEMIDQANRLLRSA